MIKNLWTTELTITKAQNLYKQKSFKEGPNLSGASLKIYISWVGLRHSLKPLYLFEITYCGYNKKSFLLYSILWVEQQQTRQ